MLLEAYRQEDDERQAREAMPPVRSVLVRRRHAGGWRVTAHTPRRRSSRPTAR
jgi:hypothetical protein